MVLITCKECQVRFEVSNKRTKMCLECSRNKRLKRCKDYKAKNKEKVSEYNKKWKSEHKEEVDAYNRNYNVINREKIQELQTKQHRLRRKTDMRYKMSITLRNRLRKFYRGKRPKTMELVGIPLHRFLKWIEGNFLADMSWQNHGTLWHIDHVVPCSWFNLELFSERQTCFSWMNMRPLYAKKNLSRKSCDLRELLCQEIIARNFHGKNTNFEPLVTKLLAKVSNGSS
jgi:hypothetical protein